jgi:hypothetical protein
MSDLVRITILDHICTTLIDYCQRLIKSFQSRLHLAESKRMEFSKAILSFKEFSPFFQILLLWPNKISPE